MLSAHYAAQHELKVTRDFGIGLTGVEEMKGRGEKRKGRTQNEGTPLHKYDDIKAFSHIV